MNGLPREISQADVRLLEESMSRGIAIEWDGKMRFVVDIEMTRFVVGGGHVGVRSYRTTDGRTMFGRELVETYRLAEEATG